MKGKPGFPGWSMEKKGKFQGGRVMIEWTVEIQGADYILNIKEGGLVWYNLFL